MLTTQIQYLSLKETKRHNTVTEDQGYKTLNENIRHNVVTENETQRHNIATENYYNNNLEELKRHNVVTETIGFGDLDVSRMRAFTEQRNAATNEMNANTNRMNANTNAANAATNRFNAVTGYSLGLEANQIAQQQANTNDRNATTRWLEWVNGTSKTAVDSRNADINQQNAYTNVMNAETRQGELDLGYQNLHQRQLELIEKSVTDASTQANNWANTGIKAAGTASNILQNLSK